MTETKQQKKVCKFYNSGYCKYQGTCKFPHPSERCVGPCNKQSCLKRHPKPCRYGDKCRRKDICDYKHKLSSAETDLKAEITALKITIQTLLDENKGTSNKIVHLESELLKVKQNTKVKKSEDIKSGVDNLDKTVEENEWNIQVEKVNQNEDKMEDIEAKTKFNSIGLSDLQENFEKLLQVVQEHDEICVKVEEKDEEKTRIITKLQNKLNVITFYSMEKYEEYVEETLEENSFHLYNYKLYCDKIERSES